MALDADERSSLDQIVNDTTNLLVKVGELEKDIRTGTYLDEGIKTDVANLSTYIADVSERVSNLRDGDHLGGVIDSLQRLNSRLSEVDEVVEQLRSGEHLSAIVSTLEDLKDKISDLDKAVGRVRDTPPESIQAQLASLDATRKVHTWLLGIIGAGMLALIAQLFIAVLRGVGLL